MGRKPHDYQASMAMIHSFSSDVAQIQQTALTVGIFQAMSMDSGASASCVCQSPMHMPEKFSRIKKKVIQ